jgi:hypothetical protein
MDVPEDPNKEIMTIGLSRAPLFPKSNSQINIKPTGPAVSLKPEIPLVMHAALEIDIHSQPIPVDPQLLPSCDEDELDDIVVDQREIDNLHSQLGLVDAASQSPDQNAMPNSIQENDPAALDELLRMSENVALQDNAPDDSLSAFVSIFSRINIVCHNSFA